MTIQKKVIIILFIVALLSGCATAPKQEPVEPATVETTTETPVEEPVVTEEVSQEEVDAILAKVENLKKEIFDSGVNTVMEEEYREANVHYENGKASIAVPNLVEAKKELTIAESSFTAVLKEGLISLSQSEGDKAYKMQEKAKAENATETASFALGEEYLKLAEQKKESNELLEAISQYKKATIAYDISLKYVYATKTKATIEAENFQEYDSGNFSIACEKLSAIDTEITNELSTAQDYADEALLRFRLVLSKAWDQFISVSKEGSIAKKQSADKIKASVSAKEEYTQAEELVKKAEKEYNEGNFKESKELYSQSEVKFQEALDIASEKREKAFAMMQNMKNKFYESHAIIDSANEKLGTEESLEEETELPEETEVEEPDTEESLEEQTELPEETEVEEPDTEESLEEQTELSEETEAEEPDTEEEVDEQNLDNTTELTDEPESTTIHEDSTVSSVENTLDAPAQDTENLSESEVE